MFKKVQFLEIEAKNHDQRIDNFLMALLKGVPKSKIYRILRKGEVRVNGSRAKPATRLVTGDVVRVPPIRVASPKSHANPGFDVAALLTDRLIEQDDDYLVLDKPPMLAVHAGSGVHSGLIEAVKHHLGAEVYVELAHRLDRETSGCLLLARNRQALLHFQLQMQSDKVKKHYLVLVKGCPQEETVRITVPLLKGAVQSGERMVQVNDNGKPADTQFEVLERFNGYSLLKATLNTGRTHQIRVHAKHMGCPVAGDRKYGDRKFNAEMKSLGLSRLFLHASYLSFERRSVGESYHFSTPLPDELAQLTQGVGLTS